MNYQKSHPNYPSVWAHRTDFIVHLAGLVLALFGGGILLGLAVDRGIVSLVWASAIYITGLIAMLSFSLFHNCGPQRFHKISERLDQAGIFLMIAASYTPFTTQALHGGWAIGMTSAIWILATLGIFGKLAFGHRGNIMGIILYLALGWMALVAFRPLISALGHASIWLLAIGGAVYSIGVIFYMMEKLKFRRAIWHIHVITGAALHYVAILLGVIIAVK